MGDHTSQLQIRYDYPPNANLDGTNDSSGRTWSGPFQSDQSYDSFHLWRACSWSIGTGYVCSPWLN